MLATPVSCVIITIHSPYRWCSIRHDSERKLVRAMWDIARAREKEVAYVEGRPTGSGRTGEGNAEKETARSTSQETLRRGLRTRQP